MLLYVSYWSDKLNTHKKIPYDIMMVQLKQMSKEELQRHLQLLGCDWSYEAIYESLKKTFNDLQVADAIFDSCIIQDDNSPVSYTHLIGGDEFVVCLNAIPHEDVVITKIKAIQQMFSHHMMQKLHHEVNCSIGVSYYPKHGKSFHQPVSYTHLDVYKRQILHYLII